MELSGGPRMAGTRRRSAVARHGGEALAGGLGWPGRRLTAWATRDMQGERTGERCTGERDGEQDASSFFAQQGGGNTKQDS